MERRVRQVVDGEVGSVGVSKTLRELWWDRRPGALIEREGIRE